MEMKTFSLNELIVIFGGVPISGYTEDDFLTITYNAPFWNHKTGADGETASIKSARFDANIRIVLLQTVITNDAMMAFLLSDFASNSPLPLLIKDLNGTTLFEAQQARIDKMPDVSYGSTAKDREWNIFVPKLLPFLGGNVR